jgi:hypothetical protein
MSHPSVTLRAPYRFVSALVFLFVIGTVSTETANGQFGGDWKKKALQLTVCSGGGIGGAKIGQKIAQVEAQKLKLSPAAAAAQQKQYELGMAMALCNGGNAIINTTFAKMTEKDKKQRQDNIDAALADSTPGTKTAALPDHPAMTETITTDPVVAEGDKECRTVKDYLADPSQGDTALIKYCRKPPDGKFEPATV